MLRHIAIAAISFSVLTACNETSSDSSEVSTPSEGLIFTGTSSSMWPWQNNLYRVNPETFEVETLLTGESSDAVVYSVGDDVVLFNRTSESLNFRVLKKDEETETFSIGEQKLYEGASSFDPHDAILLDNDVVLLANWTGGNLILFNLASGTKAGDVNADWELPEGAKLTPEAFWRTKVGSKTFIYVIHQAASWEGNLFTVNDSQRVFVLEQNGSGVIPVDLDPSTPKIDGILTQGSFPVPIESSEAKQSPELYLVSLCSNYVAVSPTGKICKNAVEVINPLTQTVELVWDLDAEGYAMNGGTVSTGETGKFFAQVEKDQIKTVHIFDTKTKTIENVYTYAEGSAGNHGLYYDEDRGNLFVGDIATDSVGKFSIYNEGTLLKEIALEAIPYSGTFVF